MTVKEPDKEIEIKRLWWHSRRGMLELDVLLIPFIEDVYSTLTDEQQARHRELLECEDPDLFMWFTTKERPIDPAMGQAVDLVLASVKPEAR